jgi:hypothetical protein
MAQGVINNGASGYCCCCCTNNHTLADTGVLPGTSATHNHQADNDAFQNNPLSKLRGDVFVAIGGVINALSSHFVAKSAESSNPLPSPHTRNTAQNNSSVAVAGGNSIDQANNDNEGMDDFIISLIEQLLETLEGLMGSVESNNTSTPDNSSSATPATPTDPLTILNDAANNSSANGMANLNGMRDSQQKLAAQLYELIEFMGDVGDNLEETGNDRISNLIGYLDQQREEQWYRNRRDEMILSLIQFLECYKDNY